MLPKKLAFVDIETTGLSVTRGRIIEIGILRIEDNRVVKTFNSLINPQGFVSPFSLQLTGIKLGDLERAPTFYEMADEIFEILKDCIFVAHNVRFDYGFVRNEFKRLEKTFTAKHFCTVKLFKHLFPHSRQHNLDFLIKHFNLKCENRHRAFDDAKVLWDFYKVVKKTVKNGALEKAILKIQKRASLPISISSKIIEDLPEKPGVYIFYGDNKTPLYVGKSIDIKERVLSHFSNDSTSSKEMNLSQQVKSIDTVITSGELSALLIESHLVKKLQPLYNRQLRITKRLYVLRKKINKTGFFEIYFEILDRIEPTSLETIIGIFRSQKQAKIFLVSFVKEFSLCEKLLGLEKTKSSCFAYRLGVCKGACINEEKAIFYNFRFINAFSRKSIKPWPFKGPILISEEDKLEKKGDYFVIDKWCLLSQYRSDDLITRGEKTYEYNFDVDTYKLFVRYLENRKNWKNITNLNLPSKIKEPEIKATPHKKYLTKELFAESA